jgi:hypothetical protein
MPGSHLLRIRKDPAAKFVPRATESLIEHTERMFGQPGAIDGLQPKVGTGTETPVGTTYCRLRMPGYRLPGTDVAMLSWVIAVSSVGAASW